MTQTLEFIMRVGDKLQAPPPPVSPERTENRPAQPREAEKVPEAKQAPEQKPPPNPPELGNTIDVTA